MRIAIVDSGVQRGLEREFVKKQISERGASG